MAALRALAQRRLTEAQLWTRLERKGYDAEEIAAAVERCKSEGYVDDKLYAELYLVGARKAVGDARMVAALVAKGVAREVALHSLASAPTTEPQRCAAALDALERRRPSLQYPSAARALERLGFPASLIYATLRARLQE